MKKGNEIKPAEGRLGILLPGMGAVATTFVAGVFAVRKGMGRPIGSLTQMGTIRLGKRTEKRVPLVKDFVPLSEIEDLVFGGWDIFEDNMYEAALHAGVLAESVGIRRKTADPSLFTQPSRLHGAGTFRKPSRGLGVGS